MKAYKDIKKDIYKECGVQLKSARTILGLSAAEAAAASRIPQPLFEQMENGDPALWGSKNLSVVVGAFARLGKIVGIIWKPLPESIRLHRLWGYSSEELEHVLSLRRQKYQPPVLGAADGYDDDGL